MPCSAAPAWAGAGACLPVPFVGGVAWVDFTGTNLRKRYFHVQGTSLKFPSYLESKTRGMKIDLCLNIKQIQYQERPKRKQALVRNASWKTCSVVMMKQKLCPLEGLLQRKISQH